MSVAATAQAKSPAVEKAPVATEIDQRNRDGQQTGRHGNAGEGARNEGEDARWRPVLGLPCRLTVDLPLPHFRVADFLHLRPGSVIATGWRLTRDVPLQVNGTLIGWGEFEGAGKRMGIRLTELT